MLRPSACFRGFLVDEVREDPDLGVQVRVVLLTQLIETDQEDDEDLILGDLRFLTQCGQTIAYVGNNAVLRELGHRAVSGTPAV